MRSAGDSVEPTNRDDGQINLRSPMPQISGTRMIMKRSPLIAAVIVGLTITFRSAFPAPAANFTGEFADRNYLKGQAVLQMSLEQSGKNVTIFFSGVRKDGQGAAPEINVTGIVTGKGTVEFKFTDDLKNSGTGTIRRAGNDMLVSIKATRIADSRAVQFYIENMRLKPTK